MAPKNNQKNKNQGKEEEEKKKPKQQSLLKNFGFHRKIVKTRKDGSKEIFTKEIEDAKSPVEDSTLVCGGCLKSGFKNKSGLKGHEACCKVLHGRVAAVAAERKRHPTVFHQAKENPPSKLKRRAQDQEVDGQEVEARGVECQEVEEPEVSAVLVDTDPKSSLAPKPDGRKGNRGSSTRVKHNVLTKHKHVMHLKKWLHDNPEESVSSYVRAIHRPNRFSYWNGLLSKWRNPIQREAIIEAAAKELHGKLKVKPVDSRFPSSPFMRMEEKLHVAIKEHRKKGRKVSRTWICVKAKQLQHEQDKIDGTTLASRFKASNGWFRRFLRRKNIKFRKRKSGKKKTTDDNMDLIRSWHSTFRYEILPNYLDERLPEQFTEKWGRFPPHLRCNIDQVPLPFVVSQDNTFTFDDDKDVHIAGHGKGDLRKRQFTMHIVVNAGEGEDRDGYIELICKGKVILGTRFSLAERSQWNKDVKMFFQPSAWMDREVMALSAERFNKHILERWGPKAKALLTCNNLDAHVFQGTKDILTKDGRVLLFCFPPSVTEAIQPIDAGYGRSVRCAIGRLLDEWLMKSDNLELWEAGMTAGQRRVLISNFVAKANEEALQNDSARISCFRRCGVLLTMDGSDDDLIKPQGCTKLPVTIPEMVDMTGAQFNDPARW